VHNVASSERFELYPNPASDNVTVSLIMDRPVKTVTYTILNTAAKVISSEIRTNVSPTDKYTYSTKTLPAGNYFMIVNADGRQMYKKFAVVR